VSLFTQVQGDMYAAMKTGEKEKAATLRNVFSALKDKKIDKRDDLTDEECLAVLRSQVKQRKDSIEQYTQGGRTDLAAQENAELEIIQSYLPQMMSEEEVRQLVTKIIAETGAGSLADMGKVMAKVMAAGQGRLDGKLASQLVREALS